MRSVTNYFAQRRDAFKAEGKLTQWGKLLVRFEERPDGKWELEIWKGKQSNSYHFCYYKSEEEAAAALTREREKEERSRQFRENRKAEERQKAAEMADLLTVGTILQGSWGYEQTNQDFYQVVERPTKFTAIIRRIGCRSVEQTGPMAEYVVPERDSFVDDETLRKRIGPYGISTEHCSLSPIEEGRRYYSSWYH